MKTYLSVKSELNFIIVDLSSFSKIDHTIFIYRLELALPSEIASIDSLLQKSEHLQQGTTYCLCAF